MNVLECSFAFANLLQQRLVFDKWDGGFWLLVFGDSRVVSFQRPGPRAISKSHIKFRRRLVLKILVVFTCEANSANSLRVVRALLRVVDDISWVLKTDAGVLGYRNGLLTKNVS